MIVLISLKKEYLLTLFAQHVVQKTLNLTSTYYYDANKKSLQRNKLAYRCRRAFALLKHALNSLNKVNSTSLVLTFHCCC